MSDLVGECAMNDDGSFHRPLDESTLTCIECGYNLTGVAIGSMCPECGRPTVESIQAFSRGERGSGTPLPHLSYVMPVLVTLLLFIGGLVAIIYTAKANTAAAAGDEVAYVAARKSRMFWLVTSAILGVLMITIMIQG